MTQMERYTGKVNRIITSNEKITLYHGSKSGIDGAIAPRSRDKCDFGKGFYMGTDQTQPLTLICNYPEAKIYTLSVDLSDMIVGYIANDRMFVVLDRFFNGEITDLALINSLSALKLGKQYVAKTEKACKNIKIIDEQEMKEEQREKLKYESEVNRSRGIELAESVCRKYRREGRFFDEILEAGGTYV